MAYNSGAFDPNIGGRPYPDAAAVYNGTLYVVGGGTGLGRMAQTTVKLDGLNIDRGDLATAKWSSSYLSISGSDDPLTRARCALAPSPQGLLLFWTSANLWTVSSSLLSSRYTDGSELGAASQPGWQKTVQLMDRDGSGVKTVPYADVAAVQLGVNTTVVATLAYDRDEFSEPAIYFGFYDVADATETSWAARWSIFITRETLQARDPDFGDSLGTNLTMDWFYTAKPDTGQPEAYTSDSPQLWLAFTLHHKTHNGNVQNTLYFLPLLSFTDGASAEQLAGNRPFDDADLAFAGVCGTDEYSTTTVARDPAGRIVVYYLGDGALSALLFDTYKLPARTQPFAPLKRIDMKVSSTDGQVTPVFYQGARVSQPTGSPLVPLYEILFFAGPPFCNVRRYGSGMISGTSLIKAKDERFLISGIIDGPIPYSNVNSTRSDIDSTYSAGVVQFDSSSEKSVTKSLSVSASLGVRSQGGFTKGVGPCWDVSMSAGVDVSSSGTNTIVESLYQLKDSVLNQKTKEILAKGAVFTTAAVMKVTAFKFVDADGNTISDGNSQDGSTAPECLMFEPVYNSDTATLGYTPFSVDPGHLASYTPESINARMKSLGYQGERGYFEEIIVPNACSYGNLNYQEASWSNDGGGAGIQFQQIHGEVHALDWNVSASAYVGVSGGFDAEFEAMSASAMAGFSFSMTGGTSSEQQSSWGVQLSQNWGPPPGLDPESNPDAIANYTIRIYFLPVPGDDARLPDGSPMPKNYWTQELINYMQSGDLQAASIDPGGACWRMFFMVRQYQTMADAARGVITYSYNDAHRAASA